MSAGVIWDGQAWMLDSDLRQQREDRAVERLVARCQAGDCPEWSQAAKAQAAFEMIQASQDLDWVEGIFEYPFSNRSTEWADERDRVLHRAAQQVPELAERMWWTERRWRECLKGQGRPWQQWDGGQA